MGNKGGRQHEPAAAAVPPPAQDEEDSQEEEEIEEMREEEATPYIQLVIFHELANGAMVERIMTIDPNITVENFKEELQQLLQIPLHDLRIYMHNGMQELQPDSATLHELYIRRSSQLRVRDARLEYANPL